MHAVLPSADAQSGGGAEGERADVGEIPFGESLERSRVHKWTSQLALRRLPFRSSFRANSRHRNLHASTIEFLFFFFFSIKIRLKFFDTFRFPFPENPMILRIFYTDVSKSISLEGEKISWREKIVAAAWWIKKEKRAASVKSKGRHTNFQLRGK